MHVCANCCPPTSRLPRAELWILQERVTDLESRLAFQDDTIETLNDILVAQQRAVERLQLQMTALLKRQEEMGGQFETSEEEAPPPHY